jgi:hypothetical protein
MARDALAHHPHPRRAQERCGTCFRVRGKPETSEGQDDFRWARVDDTCVIVHIPAAPVADWRTGV